MIRASQPADASSCRASPQGHDQSTGCGMLPFARDREIDVDTSVTHLVLVQRGVPRVRENLVHPAAEHHVSAEKQCQRIPRWLRRSLGHPFPA